MKRAGIRSPRTRPPAHLALPDLWRAAEGGAVALNRCGELDARGVCWGASSATTLDGVGLLALGSDHNGNLVPSGWPYLESALLKFVAFLARKGLLLFT